MISRLHVQNFKCLRDVRVDLAPLTVLIGPNDSGKSSILQAIDELSMILGSAQIALPGADDSYNEKVFRRDPQRDIRWLVEEGTTGQTFRMTVLGTDNPADFVARMTAALNEFVSSGFLASFDNQDEVKGIPFKLAEEFDVAVDKIVTAHPYRFQPDRLRRKSPPAPEPVLEEDGANLAAVLEAMITGPDRAALHELERTLYQTIPTLRGISVPTIVSKKTAKHPSEPLKALRFVLAGNERPPITISAEQVSDGALLLTAYLALAYSNTAEIILIEEPENGLHPSRLKMIIDLLRKMTTGEVGPHKRQIIMTTHSPLLLNYCQPDEVRVVTRDAEGATRVTPLAEVPNLPPLLQEFAIGELWYLLGEDALLRGERG